MNTHLVDSLEEARRKINEYENETFSKFFVCKTSTRNFGNAELYCKKGNSSILWLDSLPYIYMNELSFDCKYGPDRHISYKAALARKREIKRNSDHSQATKAKKLEQCSRKLGCPAKISLKEVFTFPDCKISTNNRYNKIKASKELRALLQEKDKKGIKKFILTLPANESEHKMHPVGEGSEIHQSMDEKVKLKIEELVADAMTDTAEIKRYLRQYVTKELFSKSSELNYKSNRRFFPSSKDIRNVVKRTLEKLSDSSNEQENIQHMVDEYSKWTSITRGSYECDKEVAIPTSRTTTQKDSNVGTEEQAEQAKTLCIKGAKVREMLAKIRTLSYKINDLSEMESLRDMLEPVLKYALTKTVNQKGYTVSQNKEVKLANKRKRSNPLNKNSENRKKLCPPCSTRIYNKTLSPVSSLNKHDSANNVVFEMVEVENNVVIEGTFNIPENGS